MVNKLRQVLDRLEAHKHDLLPRYGWHPVDPRSPEWWGGFKDYDEIVVAAVLAQLTRWSVVDSVVGRLRSAGASSLPAINNLDEGALRKLVSRVGFASEKSRRLKRLASMVVAYGGLAGFCALKEARDLLLSIKGVGYETADTILLFACNKVIFPVSRLGERVLLRVGVALRGGYEDKRVFIESLVPRGLYEFKLLHAGLVSVSRDTCFKRSPDCRRCVLRGVCDFALRPDQAGSRAGYVPTLKRDADKPEE